MPISISWVKRDMTHKLHFFSMQRCLGPSHTLEHKITLWVNYTRETTETLCISFLTSLHSVLEAQHSVALLPSLTAFLRLWKERELSSNFAGSQFGMELAGINISVSSGFRQACEKEREIERNYSWQDQFHSFSPQKWLYTWKLQCMCMCVCAYESITADGKDRRKVKR